MNFFDSRHSQDFTRRLTGELVCPMAGTDGNSESIHTCFLYKSSGFIWIGKQLISGEFSNCTVPIFLLSFAGFKLALASKFTFLAHSLCVSHLHDLSGDFDVVIIVGGRLAVFHEGTIHHDAGEAIIVAD